MKNYDMLTISAQNGGWVRYEDFPIYRNGHRLNPVYKNNIHCLTGFWHCIHCKLMGTETTMKEYSCGAQEQLEEPAKGAVALTSQDTTSHRRLGRTGTAKADRRKTQSKLHVRI